jgi:hypothetical protein
MIANPEVMIRLTVPLTVAQLVISGWATIHPEPTATIVGIGKSEAGGD